MVVYRVKYQTRCKTINSWTSWQDTESVIMVRGDARIAIDELKKYIDEHGYCPNDGFMLLGVEMIARVNIIAKELLIE